MKISFLLLTSALVQFTAAYLAFRMTRITKHVPAWTLISIALLLMGIRRITTLLGFSFPQVSAALKGPGAEMIALIISLLMLSSVLLIRTYFLRQNRQAERLAKSEQKYKELSEELEERIQERTAELLGATSNLRECRKVRTEFLGKMSHEFRTPLNAVLGFSDVLLAGMDGELNREQKNDVQMIFNGAQHLLELVNDILDFSKLEEGSITLESDFIQIPPVVSRALTKFRTAIQNKNLALNEEIPDTLPPVYADPERLQQILAHLIGNAVKFTAQGHLTVRAALTEQDGREPSEPSMKEHSFVQISVIDSGIGISEEDVPSIFNSFHQSDSGPSRPYEGTGLGLAITRSLVELHGGTIGVESQKNEGSRFWFTLPTDEYRSAEAARR